MNAKLLVVIVVAVAAVIGVAYYYGWISFPGGSTGVASCKPPAIIYVYANDQQKDVGKTFIGVFDLLAKNSGLSLGNYSTCIVPASSLPEKLRFYPALLLKGEFDERLMNYTFGDIDGAKILNPVITMSIIRYLRIEPVYSYHAKLLIVKAENPLGEVKANETVLKDSFSAIAMASIDSVEYVTRDEAPVKLDIAPYAVLESSDPLADQVHYLEKRGDKYYVIKKDYLVSVASNVLGARGLDLYGVEPPGDDYPAIGPANAPVKLYIFEDLWCPYCALFYNNTFGLLAEYAKEGRLRVYAVDFLIHPEAGELHSLLRCIYRLTGDGELYFRIVNETYHVYAENLSRPVMMEDFEGIVAKHVDNKTLAEAKNCAMNISSKAYVEERQKYFEEYMISGTPGFLLVPSNGKPLVSVSGYLDREEMEKLLSWAQG